MFKITHSEDKAQGMQVDYQGEAVPNNILFRGWQCYHINSFCSSCKIIVHAIHMHSWYNYPNSLCV